ncbi:flagellar associated protein [Trypanosoma grayi]|uniref:flagellar associated protein n=1 Tax=Trypanosoma grayi TaxID=71804 RepID=UPI0004F4813E|nr:flagellar associated protein [Trypanosoma grayi]KEG14552.1 flagellar associated protein [Trypanosoma grayi]
MAAKEYEGTARLTLDAVIGFGGRVPNSIIAHPDGDHLVYALGACVVIQDLNDRTASDFVYGHNDKISCITVSSSGRYIASGQMTHPGFQADVCIIDFEKRRLVHRMLLHKVKVQALAFSKDEQYLVSIGGVDDNAVVVWDVSTGRPLCGAPAHHTESKAVAFFNNNSEKLITGGVGSLRVWTIDPVDRKMNPDDVNMGNMRRSITTIAVEATDRYMYCGTTTGDVLCVLLERNANTFKMSGPQKKLSGGVTSILLNLSGDVLVGSGSGEVALLSKINLTLLKQVTVQGAVTGLAIAPQGYIVGTIESNVYLVEGGNFHAELRLTCHSDTVNDIAFPDGFSALFATCCGPDIRVWNTSTTNELLRIQINGLICNCIQFTKDGSMIVSGWDDGKLRAFGPQSGKLVFAVNDAHKREGIKSVNGGNGGVTAVCVDNTSQRIISGGADGLVRVWLVQGNHCTLEASMKEHKATVNAICVSHDNTECVSASDDGSCIVWDLVRHVRRDVIYSQTRFRAVEYFVDESQLLTTGTNKTITWWDSVDCGAIREIPGSRTGEVNSLSMSADGRYFVSGGDDRIVKVWGYDEGVCVAVGLAHSCNITKVRVSPDGKKIVSVGDEGAIMIWSVGDLNIRSLAD